MSIKWQLWDREGSTCALHVAGPPCNHCKHWSPVLEYSPTIRDLGQRYSVTMCHSHDMRRDFSCFEPKPEA
mgnify:CR=1 FL=1